jgi:DNA repair protein RadC
VEDLERYRTMSVTILIGSGGNVVSVQFRDRVGIEGQCSGTGFSGEMNMTAGGSIFANTVVVSEFFAPLVVHHRHEHAIVAHLDAQGRTVALSEVQGSHDHIILPLRQIIGDALAHDGRSVMLAHNHPSGDPTPSKADIETTRKLADLLRPLGIRVYDHLILTSTGASTSFRDLGWF